MEQRSGDTGADSDFAFDPTGKVIGVIADAGDAVAALRELAAAGLAAGGVEVLTNEEGARSLDAVGGGRGAAVRVVPQSGKPPHFYDAPGFVGQIEQHLSAGHYYIAVGGSDPEARERVGGVLKAHRGHSVNYHGKWSVQGL